MSDSPPRAMFAAVVLCAWIAVTAQANVSIRYFDEFVPPDPSDPSLSSGMLVWPYNGNIGSVHDSSLGLTRNGRYAYGSVGWDPFIWDLATNTVEYLPSVDGLLQAVSDDARVSLFKRWDAGSIYYDPSGATALSPPVNGEGYAVISADGSRFATDGVTVWDGPESYTVINGQPPYTYFEPWEPLSMSADGTRVLARHPRYRDPGLDQDWTAGIWVNGQYWQTFPSDEFWPEVMTSDGSAVFGLSVPNPSSSATIRQLKRWTEDQGVVDVIPLSDGSWELTCVSADGSLVGITPLIDYYGYDGETTVQIWDETLGLMNLKTYLASFGVDLGDWKIRRLYAMSDDGLTFIVEIFELDDMNMVSSERMAVVTIPEPAGVLMLLGGLVPFARRRR